MASERIDGDDLTAVDPTLQRRCTAAARKKRAPAVLELVTYRYRGHSVADPRAEPTGRASEIDKRAEA